MRDAPEDIEAFRAAGDGFGHQLAREAGQRHAVTGKSLQIAALIYPVETMSWQTKDIGNCETGQDASSVLGGGDVTGGDAALWVRLSVDIAQLVPRRSCLDRQGYGGTGVSVPRATRSRLRRNAQADSLA